MRITAKMLKNVANVNNWQYANQAHVQENQANDIYFQLVDLDITPAIDKSLALPDFPLRYIPQGTSIALEVTFPALRSESDDVNAEQFSVAASQPFSDDKSIWKVSLTSSQLPKSGSITMKLTIDGVDKYFLVNNALAVDLLNVGSC